MFKQTRLSVVRAKVRSANPYMRTLYAFNTLSLVGGTIYGLYYGVFLYRHTFSLSVLAVDGLLGGFGIYAGYLLGVHIIRRFGYGRTIRTAFALWIIICFGTALVANHIAQIFMIMAVVRSFPGGMYTAVADSIMLRDVLPGARSGFFQLNLALEFVASIILPTLVGGLISFTGGYLWAFIGAGLVYSVGFLVRCNLPRPDVSFRLREIFAPFRRPLYPTHALNRTMASGMNQLNAFSITIIPFLLLKNELSMGLLTSASAVVASVIALSARRISRGKSLGAGFGAHGGKMAIGVAFAAVWTSPLMFAWQLVGKLLTPLHDPVQQSLDIHNDGLVMGRDASRQALQINVLNNTLALIGTTVAFGAFLVILRAGADQQRGILRSLIIIYAGWRMVNLAASAVINRWATRQDFTPLWLRVAFRLSLFHARLRACFSRLALTIIPID